MTATGDGARVGYLPIGEHGLIGDLRTVALVGTDGTIDWYCPARFDAPSVFASILDSARGGYFALRSSVPATTKQLYFPDTNVLITRFLTPDGVGEIQDFMPIPDDVRDAERHRLIRRVSCARGSIRFEATIAPRFDYGRERHTLSVGDGVAVFETSDLTLTLAATVPLRRDDEDMRDVRAEFALREGESRTFVLERLVEGDCPRGCVDVEAARSLDQTITFWRRWLSTSRYTGRWRETVHRSALVLKLLTYAPTGAIIAAPTTSLPEEIGGGRNWDYRYTWIRDAAFSLYALLRLGFVDEAQDFMGWLTQRYSERETSVGPLQIMYGVDGTTELPEIELPHLEGYNGSAPVRIGNAAAGQLQLDIYGELIDSIYLHNKYGEPVSAHAWDQLSRIVDWVAENWDRADEGIWETRGGRRAFTYSRLMCWVAMERAVRIAHQRGLPADLTRWTARRDSIYRQIMRQGWSEKRQAFVQHYGSEVLDASLLTMPLVKFVSPSDGRWLSTLDAISSDLVSDSLVYRYDPEASPDGLHGAEGTFSICSFWYVEALTRSHRVDEARLIFEKMLTYGNHLGLYAEQIGPTGEQLGNFPQALTHLALISAAYNLDHAMRGRDTRG